MTEDNTDLDAVKAATDLAGRTGAKSFELGWLHDEQPCHWYAVATYEGAKVMGEHPTDPAIAADEMSKKVLHGGLCTHCKKTVNVKPDQGHWEGGECIARRQGDKWERGCST